MRIPFFGARKRTWRVLFMDDDPSIRETTSFVLEKAGYEVRTAKDGEEGLRVLESYEADVVIVDVMMPRLDGYKVLQAIRESPVWRRKAVMMLTARRGSEEVMKGYAHGADCYLTKPFQKDQFLDSLKMICSAVEDERSDVQRKRRLLDK